MSVYFKIARIITGYDRGPCFDLEWESKNLLHLIRNIFRESQETREEFPLAKHLPSHNAFRLQRTFEENRKEQMFASRIDIGGCSERDIIKSHTKKLFTQTVQSLYRQFKVPSKAEEVVVCGQVFHDGLGDYYHILAVAESIKSTHPEWTVRIMADFKGSEELLPKITPPATTKFDFTIYDKRTSSEERDVAEEKMKNAFAIFNVSYEKTCQLLWYLPKTVQDCLVVQFYEYGFEDAHRWGHQCMTTGLGRYDVGILFKPRIKPEGLVSLKDTPLKKLLFSQENPTPQDESSYHCNNDFVYGYIKSSSRSTSSKWGTAFVLAVCFAFEESNKTLDIVCPLWLVNCEEMQGIKEVHLYAGKDLKLLQVKTLAKEGKLVRLIDPFPLSNEDTQVLTCLSKLCVGCTGDLSFTEVLSLCQNIPFYEIMQHKQKFFIDLLLLADEQFKEEPEYLAAYFKLLLQLINAMDGEFLEIVKKCGRLMRHPKTQEQMREFNRFLKSHFCFNEVITDTISRKLAHKYHPDLAKLHNVLTQAYFKDRITLEEGYFVLKRAVELFSPYKPTSSLGKLYEALVHGQSREELQPLLDALSQEQQNLIYGHVWEKSGRPQTPDVEWGRHHALDKKDKLCSAIEQMLSDKLAALSADEKNTLYGTIYQLAGVPKTDDPQWGERHAWDVVSLLADALS